MLKKGLGGENLVLDATFADKIRDIWTFVGVDANWNSQVKNK